MNEPAIMTLGEVANYLRIHKSTLYRLLRDGKVPAFRVGQDWRFYRDDIDKWRLGQGQNEGIPARP